ncbi:hypothetical protein GN958_ATG13140 [Phytophthora infestans]|uniref:Retrovirus-related Pol polyprotein from transposon TNT 1-94-like beta-barrel domain-containing protein n=1 Tax=Phytophthora infestans TaxID=4787 RepID=A0A8S9UGR5_PHYIN|nr:hypothetical protein GN958_ATG13140 [Phytophthora infestans]
MSHCSDSDKDDSSFTSDDSDGQASIGMAAVGIDDPAKRTPTWLVDSGASHHMGSREDGLIGAVPSTMTIPVANGEDVTASMKCSCLICVSDGCTNKAVLNREVHSVAEVHQNLLSVTELADHVISSQFNSSKICELKDCNGKAIAVANRCGKW